MEVVILIALVFGTSFAIVRGTEHAGRQVRKAYRTRVARFTNRLGAARQTARGTPAPSPTGIKVGAALATGVLAAGYAGKGFLAGVRAGWPEGRRRAFERWGTPAQAAQAADHEATARAAAADGTPTTPTTPSSAEAAEAAEATDAAAPTDGPSFVERTENGVGRPHLRVVDGTTPADAGTGPVAGAAGDDGATHSTGGTAMAIDTVTGGEVLTMEQLEAELGTIITEAGADLEDARGDADRAKEDGQRIERMVASLTQLDLDADTLSEVGALADTASARQAAADQRAAAAEARHSQAQTALEGMRSRHQLMREAHASTPHAADKSFYGA